MDDDELLRQQVAALNSRVSTLEREVFELKKSIPYQSAPTVSAAAQPVMRQETASALSAAGQPEVRKEKNLEKKLGKNIMGIAAAILILVSLILFGGLLLPYITNVVKFVIMYAICIGFAVVGIVFMRNESKYRVLFSAIAAVGISGCYITDLIGRFSFEILNDFSLLALIGVWLVATVFLSKFKSRMFAYVSDAGLVVATILMAVNWPNTYFEIVVFFVGLLVLWWVNKSKDFVDDFYIFVQIPIMTLVFLTLHLEITFSIILILINLATFAMISVLYKFDKKAHIPLVIICYGMILTSTCVNVFYFAVEVSVNCLVILPVFGAASFLIWKFKKANPFRRIMCYVTFYSMVTMYLFTIMADEGAWENIPWYPIAAIILVILAVVTGDQNFKYSGIFFAYLAILLCYGITTDTVKAVSGWAVGILVVGLIHYMQTRKYAKLDKYLALGLGILMITTICVELETSTPVTFLLFGLLCLYTCTRRFVTNRENKMPELSSDIVNWVFTGIMIIIGDICVAISHESVYVFGAEIPGEVATTIILITLTVALNCINLKRLFNSRLPKSLVGVWTCIKLMFLLIVILARFDAVSMMITIFLLVFAVLCIVFGFKIEIKVCRIYGLVLTLLCVLKLIIFDITYDSLIMRPVGFFIAGALCFGISWGYSRIEKTHGKSEE